MGRTYAVVRPGPEGDELICASPDYDPSAVTGTAELSGGLLLRNTGGEETDPELQRQLREALEANASKEQFLSSMSHDIRTPMNAIVGMTALAKSTSTRRPGWPTPSARSRWPAPTF